MWIGRRKFVIRFLPSPKKSGIYLLNKQNIFVRKCKMYLYKSKAIAGQVGRDKGRLCNPIPPPPSLKFQILQWREGAGGRTFNKDIMSEGGEIISVWTLYQGLTIILYQLKKHICNKIYQISTFWSIYLTSGDWLIDSQLIEQFLLVLLQSKTFSDAVRSGRKILIQNIWESQSSFILLGLA